jgi:hypothetical protein
MSRIARCDYNKPHRCPGWSGAGWTFNRHDWCDGVASRRWLHDRDRDYQGLWWLRVRKTACCGTYVLPHILVWLDWRTWTPHRVVKGVWYWYPWERVSNIPTAIRMWLIRRTRDGS